MTTRVGAAAIFRLKAGATRARRFGSSWLPPSGGRPLRAAPVLLLALACVAAACRSRADEGPLRASGYVEATEVRVAPEVGGRIVELKVEEGSRVAAGAVIARLDTTDAEIALRKTLAERAQAAAQLRLLQAGARPEDIRQARAQEASAKADAAAAESEVQAADADLARF